MSLVVHLAISSADCLCFSLTTFYTTCAWMHIGVDAVHTPTPVSSVACHRTNLPVGFADGPFPLPRERLALSATVGKPSFALRRNGPSSPSTAAPRAARNPDHSESAPRSRWDLRSLHGDRKSKTNACAPHGRCVTPCTTVGAPWATWADPATLEPFLIHFS